MQYLNALKSAFLGIEHDPLFTFPYMKDIEDKRSDVETMLFVKTGGKHLPQDKPHYKPKSKDIRKLPEEEVLKMLLPTAKDYMRRLTLDRDFQVKTCMNWQMMDLERLYRKS